jgi:hypothetical protein
MVSVCRFTLFNPSQLLFYVLSAGLFSFSRAPGKPTPPNDNLVTR